MFENSINFENPSTYQGMPEIEKQTTTKNGQILAINGVHNPNK